MKTLDDINKAEEATRERAWSYQRVKDEEFRLRKTIARLEGSAVDVGAIETMTTLAGQLPKDLTTRGRGLIAGGHEVRGLLISVLTDAWAELERRAIATTTALTKAKADLVKVERTLATFKEDA